MRLNTQHLRGDKLLALDGEMGQIHDFYFDDQTWEVRYLVADTGGWLGGRHVLLAPPALGSYDPVRKQLSINLLKHQIEASPQSENHQPVSRQYEEEYYRHYQWPAYWNSEVMAGMGAFPIELQHFATKIKAVEAQQKQVDSHLRSTNSLCDYAIEAIDGTIGRVSGFLVDERNWRIRALVAETGNWYSGRELFLPTDCIKRTSHEKSKVFVTISKYEIQTSNKKQINKTGAVGE